MRTTTIDASYPISVVLPVFNGERTLSRALESIKAQISEVNEVVIVNDGSTDGTIRVIHAWRNQLPLRVLNQPKNQGLIASLQLGVSEAQHPFIARLDADDEWLPNHVLLIRSLFKQFPETVLVSSEAEAIWPNDRRQKLGVLGDEAILRHIMWDNPLVHSSVCFRRDAYFSVGGYQGPKYAEDYDLWVRLLTVGSWRSTCQISVYYYVTENSESRIERIKALTIRWSMQKRAIRTFWKRHPLYALTVLLIIFCRVCLRR